MLSIRGVLQFVLAFVLIAFVAGTMNQTAARAAPASSAVEPAAAGTCVASYGTDYTPCSCEGGACSGSADVYPFAGQNCGPCNFTYTLQGDCPEPCTDPAPVSGTTSVGCNGGSSVILPCPSTGADFIRARLRCQSCI